MAYKLDKAPRLKARTVFTGPHYLGATYGPDFARTFKRHNWKRNRQEGQRLARIGHDFAFGDMDSESGNGQAANFDNPDPIVTVHCDDLGLVTLVTASGLEIEI